MTLDDDARRALNSRLEAAFKGIQSADFATADAALGDAADIARADADETDRVARWRLLSTYAREFHAHRSRALAAAAQGRDYEVNGQIIAVIDINEREFVYRDRGKTLRVAPRAIPEPIVLAIVEAWYAGNPQPGNKMFLGSHLLTKTSPDLAAARDQWQSAAFAGEPSARPMLALLNDPVIRAAAAE